MIQRVIIVAIFLVLIGGLVFLGVKAKQGFDKRAAAKQAAIEEQERLLREEQERQVYRTAAMEEAKKLALSYDYDAAIEKLQSIDNYETDDDICQILADIQVEKSNLVPVDMNNITHIFYHSLVVDPELAFAGSDGVSAGFKQWMTTTSEFDKITQQMYDRGYVLVSLYDLIDQKVDENGQVHISTHQLYLPEGKTPYVLSLDDLSYYHSYDGRGIATKMIVGSDGKPTCEYLERDGSISTGPYDCIPRLDQFLEAHPDAAYRGAKGTVALTGYDGILGYRTDIAYKTRENLSEDQAAWLNAHPDFDWDKECEEARKVADAIKADGWTFASHTWGHIRIGDASLQWIQEDTEKWLNYVAPLVGGTDCIIFAHGQDLANWHDYSSENEKFAYLKSKGFNLYCNVDSSQYFLQIRDSYLRMGRRNLDGYRLWNDTYGEKNRTSDLIDAASCLDPARNDMPSL